MGGSPDTSSASRALGSQGDSNPDNLLEGKDMKTTSSRARRMLQVVGTSSLALPLCVALYSAASSAQTVSSSQHRADSLAEEVREGTARFRDINVAMRDGYAAATSCVSGPDTGAMGVHLVHMHNGQPDRVADGQLIPEEPEALIYEPQADGSMRLVGVEFIEIASDWNSRNPQGPPSVAGNLMNLVGEPNRFGLPAFYELHVWAWEHNPRGSFADWNTQVTCEHNRGE
jgi:hypothetical protein